MSSARVAPSSQAAPFRPDSTMRCSVASSPSPGNCSTAVHGSSCSTAPYDGAPRTSSIDDQRRRRRRRAPPARRTATQVALHARSFRRAEHRDEHEQRERGGEEERRPEAAGKRSADGLQKVVLDGGHLRVVGGAVLLERRYEIRDLALGRLLERVAHVERDRNLRGQWKRRFDDHLGGTERGPRRRPGRARIRAAAR